MMSQTTLAGTVTQLPQLCQVSWSRCPCSKANPTSAVVSKLTRASLLFQDTSNSKPGLPHALSPSGHCFKRTQSKYMLYYHKIQDCKPRASPTAPETRTSTSTGPGMPSLCPAAHACQASPTATGCRPSCTSGPEGTVHTHTAQCCLSSPASRPFYSTINTGWRRNR